MFNPRPRIAAVPIGAATAYVIDDALVAPERLVEFAVANAARFEDAPHNAFPGPELRMPDAVSQALDLFFAQHVRGLLGARRTLRTYSRLAMVTRAPDALEPRQWVCHRDRLGMAPTECAAASVLYLFRDERLGGTSFFAPRRPLADVERMIEDSARMDRAAFAAAHGVAPGYMTASNAWFDKVATVAPRFNRIVFYDGSLFHCSDIAAPERLSTDFRRGRLTLNGFFTCRRAAT
jgi:hypothetical protein